ncbi:MAG: VacB/RNase II family 3'-5' exoribonuclease, partial [Pseudomonadota bacterium]
MAELSESAVLEFIQNSSEPLTKRQISQAFKVKGGENRIKIKQILKALKNDGVITKHSGGGYSAPEGLPSVGIVEVSNIDVDGDVFVKLTEWNAELQGDMPRIELMPDKKGHASVAEGDRVLARFSRVGENTYEARVIKRLDNEHGRVLGIVRYNKHGSILAPTDKKAKYDFVINPGDLNGAKEGDLALGEIQPGRGLKRKKVRVVEVLGKQGDPKAISLISMHENGLSENWPDAVLKETKGMKVPELKGREDLRDVPLVTIDGADARDFDDAVFAEQTDDGGFHIIVAIADVAYYVRHGSALDAEAMRRGNSTYFPDRVVPMLPEALSNDLCSLRPKEPRACMAVHMWIDADGKLTKYKFVRGLMRSAARLIYEQVQAARDGVTDDITGPLMEGVIAPLYGAYAVLDAARTKRGALDLDLPEKQILINEKNEMTGVKVRERLDAHKMIEEFMILANVAAASALEDKKDPKRYPCVYRVHDQPSNEKLDSVREFIESFGLKLPKGSVSEPSQINGILKQAAKLPYSHLISTVILRSQSQAIYHPQNIGHFGLALQKYAHFTSPIRRYADLLVHRSLISAYGLGPGGIS